MRNILSFIDNRNAIIDRFTEDIFQTSEFNEGIENYSSGLKHYNHSRADKCNEGRFFNKQKQTDTGIVIIYYSYRSKQTKATEDYLNNDNNDLSNKTILIGRRRKQLLIYRRSTT